MKPWEWLGVVVAWALLVALALGLAKAGAYGLTLFAASPFLMAALTQRSRPTARTFGSAGRSAALLLLPLGVGSAAYDSAVVPSVYEVTTSIEIAATPDSVWQHVITYADMPEPTEWLFRSGIAYPRRVRLAGAGVGATRFCDFSTGSFVEPITAWEPARRLEFDVVASAAPMKEWSPYGDIEPAHLHGYFNSRKGRFVLQPLENGHTRLEGATWYEHGLEPGPYWRWWSDAIVHRIHRRVLTHIKQLSERP
jgi:hypothetical protein